MVEDIEKEKNPAKGAERHDIVRRLGAVGWGLFFIWIGIGVLSGISSSVTLVGIGVIILGVQVARVIFKLNMEAYWCVVGVCFLLGGVWQWLDAEVSLVPILLIAGGLAVLLAGFLPKRRQRSAD